jgi:tetratricopeptide (TPR) repeat protein
MPSENEDELVFRSELGLHIANLLLQLGRFDDCITYIRSNPRIRDVTTKIEIIANAQIALNLRDDALATLRELIQQYPENGDYFEIIERQMTPDDYLAELFVFKEIFRSRYAEVRILELLPRADSRFVDLLRTYLVPYLVKGSPAIFVCLSDLSPDKFDDAIAVARAAAVPITSVPIVHNFVADVLISRGEYEAALAEVEAGIAHTPTVLELMQTKIRILRKLGRVSEAAATAADLIVYDPADRGTNTICMNIVLLNGELNKAIETALPFSIDHKARPKLFQTQYNQLCLRCGDCCVRAGDRVTAIKFYQLVVKTFDTFRKSQFNYLGWAMKKICSLVKMIKWADSLVTDKVLARAVVALIKLHFQASDVDAAVDLALRMVHATEPVVLGFCAVAFAKKIDPLPALRCFLRTQGPAKFLAAPIIVQMMDRLAALPDVAREVATELYTPFENVPETTAELIMAARGAFFVDDKERAAVLLKQAAGHPLGFREALDVFGIAKFEFDDAALADEIQALIHETAPKYEITFAGQFQLPPDLSILHVDDD